MIPLLALSSQGPDLSGLAGASGPDLTRYLVVCGVLLLLIVALGYGFRRLTAGGLRSRLRSRALSTVDVLALGRRQKVAVVRCYDKTYLIGCGEKELCLLAVLDEDSSRSAEAPVLTALKAKQSAPPAEPSPARKERFLDALRQKTGEAAPRATPPRRAPGGPSLPGGGLLG
jgi:flagellar biogenesis protein FliO